MQTRYFSSFPSALLSFLCTGAQYAKSIHHDTGTMEIESSSGNIAKAYASVVLHKTYVEYNILQKNRCRLFHKLNSKNS